MNPPGRSSAAPLSKANIEGKRGQVLKRENGGRNSFSFKILSSISYPKTKKRIKADD